MDKLNFQNQRKMTKLNTKQKKKKIKQLVVEMLKQSKIDMTKKIDRALDSGAIDIDEWDPNYNSMVLPKIIITAILKNESHQYEGKGTMYQKYVEKEVNNLICFL